MGFRLALVSIVFIIVLAADSAFGYTVKQGSSPKVRAPRPNQKLKTEPPEKVDSGPPPETETELLRRAITSLSEQVTVLAGEVRKLRKENERGLLSTEMTKTDERLAKAEDSLKALLEHKRELEEREQQGQTQLQNIRTDRRISDLMLRRNMRQDQAESYLRDEIQRNLDDIQNQKTQNQERIDATQTQVGSLRTRLEEMQKKLQPEDATDKPVKP